MKLKLLLLFLLLSPVAAVSQSFFAINGWCEIGGQATVTQGLSSSGTKPLSGGAFAQGSGVQASFPRCTISVYVTGTQTIVPLFSTSTGTGVLSNPFTGNVDGSFLFWVGAGCYDVVTSSGSTTGSVMPTPHTYTGLCVGQGGGGATVNCAVALNGSIAAFQSPTSIYCDQQMSTDFAGNGAAQSWTLLGPVNGIVGLIGGGNDPGTSSVFTLALNEVRFLAPLTASPSYYQRLASTPGTAGYLWYQSGQSTDLNGDTVVNMDWLSPNISINSTSCPVGGSCTITTGSSTELQTNGVDNANCVAGACPLLDLVAGSNITLTNTSGGHVQIAASSGGTTSASNPSAPTVAQGGSAGGTSDSYAVVGCEDVNCTYHSTISPTGSTSTANATLTTSNYNLLTAYADTLYGYRFYKVCRLTAGGTPSTTGVIATGAGKAFKDTGLAGDGSNCASTYASNTTILDDHCLSSSINAGSNQMRGAPCGINAPPVTVVKESDELTAQYGSCGDVNDGVWTWVNQNSATCTWTGGMASLTSPARGSDTVSCMVETAPATPYTFTMLMYTNPQSNTTENFSAGIAFYESGSTKAEVLGVQHNGSTLKWVLWKYTNPTTSSGSFPVNNGTGYIPQYLKIAADGTNITFYSSPDGIVYTQIFQEAKAAFFTTAPDRVGFCIDNNVGVSSAEVDFWRRIQ